MSSGRRKKLVKSKVCPDPGLRHAFNHGAKAIVKRKQSSSWTLIRSSSHVLDEVTFHYGIEPSSLRLHEVRVTCLHIILRGLTCVLVVTTVPHWAVIAACSRDIVRESHPQLSSGRFASTQASCTMVYQLVGQFWFCSAIMRPRLPPVPTPGIHVVILHHSAA